MKKKVTFRASVPMILLLGNCLHAARPAAAQSPTELLDAYDVVWDTPGKDARDSLPIGNGVVGANVWIEADGDLIFYISRNDSLSEVQRLMKIGRVRVHLDPNPFVADQSFHEVLRLRQGRLDIAAGTGDHAVHMSVLVDAGSPTIYVTGASARPESVQVTLEDWRDAERKLNPTELESSWILRGAPPEWANDATESADRFPQEPDAVVWYHRNSHSVVARHIAEQGLSNDASFIRDTLLNNTFGGYISGAGFTRSSPTLLKSTSGTKSFELRISTETAQTPTADGWLKLIRTINKSEVAFDQAAARTAQWWEAYWDRSYVFIDGAEQPGNSVKSPSEVTTAYIYSKYQLACQMRGTYPAHFQGGIFTVDPKYAYYGPDIRKIDVTPDYRFYGANYWWQNTRFLYLPQLAQGNFDLIQPFFKFYLDEMPLFEARAKQYYGAKGTYMQECISTFGLPGMGDFGYGAKIYSEPYTRDIWQQCLELSVMLLDYYEYTGDNTFLREKALPWANSALEFYDTRFGRDANGKLRIAPTHAVETYWTDVVNDAPSVAGLHYVIKRLLDLPRSAGTEADRTRWKRLQKELPPLPKRVVAGKTVPDNAESYNPRRTNYEAPDLYSVFPFRLYGIGDPTYPIEEAREAFRRMPDPDHTCWYQTGIFAALLGLTDEAKRDIVLRASAHLAGFRFAGFFGSPHDWCPDEDGPGNMSNTLQEMLMQCEGKTIRLLPSWPREWDVRFKLHAPRNTIVECTYRHGEIVGLTVTPPARRKDVILPDSDTVPAVAAVHSERKQSQ